MKSLVIQFQILFILFIAAASNTVQANENLIVYNGQGDKVKEIIHIDENNHKLVKYHDNGAIKEQGFFKKGLKNGCWLAYDSKGNCISRVYFDMGNRTGIWDIKTYDRKYSYQIAYEDDKAVMVKKINADGEVLEKRAAR